MSGPEQEQWETVAALKMPDSIPLEHRELFRTILEQRVNEKFLKWLNDQFLYGNAAK